ncbi:MAG: hypothetical protein JXA25_01800 [Anaerolineales bacterium]|nr:hypothetical protein [Anaerolineales bacterium]
METPIPGAHKWLFWLILGAFSTFFAEVFAGSDMFPFFNLWGIVIVWPLYGLHTIILTTIIFRYGKPTLPVLIFAGMLFGLYEAYMTKVLWQPDWDVFVHIADLAVFELFVLVFWWHTWLSFITPLLLSEQLLTKSSYVLNGLSGKVRSFYTSWKGYLALVLFGGVFQSINSPSIGLSLFSGISTVSFLFLLTWLWKRITNGRNYTLPDLLPSRKQFTVLSIWLAALYLFLGFAIYPERIPGPSGQGLILLFYLVLILLFIHSLRLSRRQEPPETAAVEIPLKRWLQIWLVFVITLVISRAVLGGVSNYVALVFWLAGSVFGTGMFVYALKVLRKRPL